MTSHKSKDAGETALLLPGEYCIMVLLVDDQPMVGEAVRRALATSEPNIAFHYCSDPAIAVAIAEQIKPTVILQDLVMPGVDGLDLVREYRANAATQDIPIIVLSTREDPGIKSEAFTAGANDYLVKLPDKIELIARVRYHSKAYLNQIQRDEIYRALRESQQKLMKANLELQRLCKVDGLTGLSNKRYFNDYMALEWKRTTREQSALSVLMIDVDDFKCYNDTYGHLAGDEVLKQVGEAIQKSSNRPTDLAARFGGEEFVVLLPSTELDGARHIGEKCRRSVEALCIPHIGTGTGKYVTISVGGASTVPPRGDVVFQRLIDIADQALYEAKKNGKNQVVTHQKNAV